MASFDETLARVAEEKTKPGGLVVLFTGIKNLLSDAFAAPGAGTILSPDVHARVDAIFAEVTEDPERVQTALDANTTGKAPPSDPILGGKAHAGEHGAAAPKSRG